MDWTKDRIEPLTSAEIRQLRANAQARGRADVLALCDEVLVGRPSNDSSHRATSGWRVPAHWHLVSRRRAFELHGVILQSPSWSWGGVRRADGRVVMSLWADDVQVREGAFSYLLWAPNVAGSRPWSDTPGGQERLEHCRLALKQGGEADGLLVYGERLEGRLPEERAFTVHGADARNVLIFQVTQLGENFWAIWGTAAARAKMKSAARN